WSASAPNDDPGGFPAPVNGGHFSAAVAEFKPDSIHVHGSGFAVAHADAFAAAGLPVTVWAPDFDPADEPMRELLAQHWMRRAYCSPHRLPDAGAPKLRGQATPFDSSLFRSAA